MTPIDLEGLRALLKRATPGPWCRNIPPITKYPTIFVGRNTHIFDHITSRGIDDGATEANIDLLLAAVNALPALLALAERAQAAEAELTALRARDAGWSLQSEESAEEIARLKERLEEAGRLGTKFACTLAEERARSAAQPAAGPKRITLSPKVRRKLAIRAMDRRWLEIMKRNDGDEGFMRDYLGELLDAALATGLAAPPAAAAERAPHGDAGGGAEP